MAFGWGFWEVLGLNEVMGEHVSLAKTGQTYSSSLLNPGRGHSHERRQVAVCKPLEEGLPESKQAGTYLKVTCCEK